MTELPFSSGLPLSEGTAELSGNVHSVERKFEWNIGRLYTQQQGETKAHAITVAVVSTLLVIPAALTLIVDLGRALGFLIGQKSPTVAKYFDGKSWSLIDKVSPACKAVSDKVKSVFHSIVTPRVKTTEELNIQSEKKMKEQAVSLVDAYRALSKERTFTEKGEERINQAKKALVESVNDYIRRNATSPADLKGQIEAVEKMIHQTIDETAKDCVFIRNKTLRDGSPELLRNVICDEFSDALYDGNQVKLAEQYVELAKAEPAEQFTECLRAGVQTSGLLTAEQAKTAVKEQAPVVYLEALSQGLDAAKKAEDALLAQAEQSKLITGADLLKIPAEVRLPVETLAQAAAAEVVRKKIPEKKIEAYLAQAGETLQKQDKIGGEQRNEFATTALGLIASEKEAQELEKAEQAQAQAAEALKVDEEARALEAEKAAIAQKEAEQNSLFAKFQKVLGLISKKQAELNGSIEKRDQLNAECEQITADLEKLQARKVPMILKGELKNVELLEAAKIYHKEELRISKGSGTDEKKARELRQLVNNDQDTIEAIKQLDVLSPALLAKTQERADVSASIKTAHAEVSELIRVYEAFAKKNKGQLEAANKKEVDGLKQGIDVAQKALDKRCDKLFDKSFFDGIRASKPAVVDAESRVDALIQEAEAAKAVEQEKTEGKKRAKKEKSPKVVPQMGLGRRAWNTVREAVLDWNG